MIDTRSNHEAHAARAFHVGRQANPLAAVLAWVYPKPGVFPLALDLIAWPVGLALGWVVAALAGETAAASYLVRCAIAAILVHGLLAWSLRLYRHRWRIASFQEVSALGFVWATTSTILVLTTLAARASGLPASVAAVATASLAGLGMVTSVRVGWRRCWEARLRPDSSRCQATIVMGAGERGAQLVRSMLLDPDSSYRPVALLDDDRQKRQREIYGVRVQGGRNELATVATRTGARVVVVAVAHPRPDLLSAVAQQAAEAGIDMRIVPSASQFVGHLTAADIRPPGLDDLLTREPVEVDVDSIAAYVTGRRVLITGAGGLIGSELARQINDLAPSELYLLDWDENALHDVQLSLDGHPLDSETIVLADIGDRDHLIRLFDLHRPEVVFHAAARKHLGLLETHPMEAVKTNVVGTKNLLDAAVHVGVDRFVNISSDIVVDPTSVLGATELAAERLTALAAAETGRAFLSVRFGNVIGGQGSVVSMLIRQLEEGGPVTVTHPEATRFLMPAPEAVRLVLQAGAVGRGGEVLVLDMGEPVRILDLARQLVAMLGRGTPIVFTGLPPGEKLHAELLGPDEVAVARRHPRIVHMAADLIDPCPPLAAQLGVDEWELRRMVVGGVELRLVDGARNQRWFRR